MAARWFPAVLGAGMALASGAAEAHHSVNSVVDINRRIQQNAVLTKVDWINPHVWMHFDVTTAEGVVVKDVQLETLGIVGMRRAGFKGPDEFELGASYRITYFPNRDGNPGGYIFRMINGAGRQLELRQPSPPDS